MYQIIGLFVGKVSIIVFYFGKRHIQIAEPAPFSLITSSSLVPTTQRVSNFPNTTLTFYKIEDVIDQGYIYKAKTNKSIKVD
jgi:hypothetical protein